MKTHFLQLDILSGTYLLPFIMCLCAPRTRFRWKTAPPSHKSPVWNRLTIDWLSVVISWYKHHWWNMFPPSDHIVTFYTLQLKNVTPVQINDENKQEVQQKGVSVRASWHTCLYMLLCSETSEVRWFLEGILTVTFVWTHYAVSRGFSQVEKLVWAH